MDMLEVLKSEGLFLPNSKFNPSYTKKFINSLTPERKVWFDSQLGLTLSEKIYNIINDNHSKPKCHQCGKRVKFISFGKGYREFCSSTCRAKGNRKQVEITNMKMYGVKHPAQNKAVMDKMKATTKEHYGVENIFYSKEYIQGKVLEKLGVDNPMHLDLIKEKMIATNLERYGKRCKDIVAKRSKTNLAKYGNVCSIHGSEVWKKILDIKNMKYLTRLFSSERVLKVAEPLFSLSEYKGTVDSEGKTIDYLWKCLKCGEDFNDYIANGKIPRCSYCYPPKIQGVFEKELVDWIRTIAPDTKIILNTRKLIKPLEIDIYIPEYKFAIEFNEVYWHSEMATKGVRGEKYHINKTKACRDIGIKLIHIYDSEWFSTPEIVKSVISSNLGIYSRKIGARKCEVRKIAPDVSREFLYLNHLQGYSGASIRYGLYLGEELVAHLALGKNRFKPNTYEIVRYVSKINTQVQGGLSKLWAVAKLGLPDHFTLISYVDLRYFLGESNTILGLKYNHSNDPSYFYTKDYISLHNRLEFQKHKLEKKLELFDVNLTEWENMQLNGYDRIWDCGTAVYELIV